MWVTVTINGTNDTPDIVVVEVTGAVTEDTATVEDNPNTVGTETGSYLIDSGSLIFADLDTTDTSLVTSSFVSATVTTGTTSVSGGLSSALQNLTDTFKISGDGVGSAAHDGTVNWSFALDNGLTQYLSAGEVVTVTYRVTVTDDSGITEASGFNEVSARTQDVAITITGINDDPVITVVGDDSAAETLTESNATLDTSGTLSVADVDLTNTVSVAVTSVDATDTLSGLGSGNAALLSMLTVDSGNIIASGATVGTINWDFDSSNPVTDEMFDYLAAGEHLTLTYVVTVTDSSGGTDTQNVVVTINGTNDTPDIVVVEVTGAVTEDTATVEDNPNTVGTETGSYLIDSGSLTFADLDTTDTSLVTSSFVSATVTTGTTSVSGGLSSALQNLTDTFKISGDGVGSAAHDGMVNWSFALDNGLTQYLSAGEVVTVTYRVTVTDDSGITEASGFNEVSARTQDVAITITGINDDPVITVVGDDSAAETLTESNATLDTSGTLSVADVDLTNTVSVAVTSVDATDTLSGLGSGNAALLSMLTVDSGNIIASGATVGTINWDFDSSNPVTDEMFDYLAAGEHLTLTYVVTVTDSSGGTDTQNVVVTINGTNDAPTITGTDDNETIVETNASGRTATGTLTLGDLDYSNTVSTQVHSVSIAGGSETTGLASELLNNTDDALLNLMSLTDGSLANNEVSDTFDWTFNSSSYTFDYLSEGESLILDYTIRATDSNDPAGTVDRVVTVTINGTNDTPDIVVVEVTGAVTEDTATVEDNPNTVGTETGSYLIDSGSLTFADLDTTDTSLVTSSFVSATVTTGTTSVSGGLSSALQNLTDTFKISGDGGGQCGPRRHGQLELCPGQRSDAVLVGG